ncbi:MAG: hypothetical protein DRP42_02420 [Tenericutes bacterium]|nr:MAG: hypothetical protein DRP42_02420 [Mycoplasmatota bacterium]
MKNTPSIVTIIGINHETTDVCINSKLMKPGIDGSIPEIESNLATVIIPPVKYAVIKNTGSMINARLICFLFVIFIFFFLYIRTLILYLLEQVNKKRKLKKNKD